MANVITAGNSSNGGTAITTDTSGTLNIVTGSGSGTTAVTVDGSGNMVVTGTLSASGGVSGGIRSGTAVTASGTSVDFTSLPTGIKRVTVMFNGVSTNGTSNLIVQIGSGSFTTSGYNSVNIYITSASGAGYFTATTGFFAGSYNTNTDTMNGVMVLNLITSNTWSMFGTNFRTGGVAPGGSMSAVPLALGGVLDRVRITTVNGTDTFDAGTINIIYE